MDVKPEYSMSHWTLDDIPWDRFDNSLVNPETLKVIKAAAMVEHNADDYVAYLSNIFPDDPQVLQAIRDWGVEEVQHGEVLRRWAELADPDWSFEAAFKAFREGYSLPLDAKESVRGSRVGELIARCIVETGTSSWYTAIMEGSDEPVLKEICRRVAADELRHYKLFYVHMQRYLTADQISRWKRLQVAAGRITETEDDELAYAYYAANFMGKDENRPVYDRTVHSKSYLRRAYAFYRPHHLDRALAMIFKAIGLSPRGKLQQWACKLGWWLMESRARKLAKTAV